MFAVSIILVAVCQALKVEITAVRISANIAQYCRELICNNMGISDKNLPSVETGDYTLRGWRWRLNITIPYQVLMA